ncbi:MAG: hypothetical protein CFE24_10220 [Flavobacterium sp. BFFFF2]|nr:MAG: hypothetical protein CFE24_10220 [Flavobacterium sp. BFFFF2]
MKNDDEIIQSLIAGGIIGAALGALVSNDKEEGAALGALAGAAILATFKANEIAMQSNLPMYVEENGDLYQIQPGGSKKFIRTIEKPTIQLQKRFKLT